MTASSARSGAVLLAIFLSAPTVAQTPQAQSPPATRKALDPNEVICEKQEVVGSRLATRRVCMTRAKWADLRLQDRQAIEHAQNTPMPKSE